MASQGRTEGATLRILYEGSPHVMPARGSVMPHADPQGPLRRPIW